MKQNCNLDFIVIDDDPINNHISKLMIRMVESNADVKTFTQPEKGLEHILTLYDDQNAHNLILFLDINMPTLSGWQVLDKFENFPDLIKTSVKIFMLSSSVDPQDRIKAESYMLVSGYLQKPISKAKLDPILDQKE